MKTNMMIKKEPAFLLYKFCLNEQARAVARGKSRSVISMSIKRLFLPFIERWKNNLSLSPHLFAAYLHFVNAASWKDQSTNLKHNRHHYLCHGVESVGGHWPLCWTFLVTCVLGLPWNGFCRKISKHIFFSVSVCLPCCT